MDFRLVRVPQVLSRRLPKRFPGSTSYWERRYRQGGSSGCGSFGRLAHFKAEVINRTLQEMDVESVIEWGFGDGNQLSLIKPARYIGVEVSEAAIATCRERYAGDESKRFLKLEEAEAVAASAEVALSLDVIYHLVEDDVFDRYMRNLFGSAENLVIIYSSNHDETPEKAPHVRHRRFTDWVDAQVVDWAMMKMIPNRYPLKQGADPSNHSFADFFVYERVGRVE